MDDITRRVGIDPIEVPPVDKTAKELKQLRKEGRIMVYNPAISYTLLERTFPDMQIVNEDERGPDKDLIEDMADIGPNLGNRAEGSDLEYLVNKQTGWSDVGIEPIESDPVLLRYSISKDRLFFESSKKPKRPARLSTYILGSQANRLVTGHFLSFSGGKMYYTHYKWKNYPTVTADFKPNGEILIKRSHVDMFDPPAWAR